MKKLIPFLFKIHKYLGLFISAFFLMWFVTGVVRWMCTCVSVGINTGNKINF